MNLPTSYLSTFYKYFLFTCLLLLFTNCVYKGPDSSSQEFLNSIIQNRDNKDLILNDIIEREYVDQTLQNVYIDNKLLKGSPTILAKNDYFYGVLSENKSINDSLQYELDVYKNHLKDLTEYDLIIYYKDSAFHPKIEAGNPTATFPKYYRFVSIVLKNN